MKLSIIIPIYNVEKYLRKCVDSLLAQDYSDYEIILVDDGSTDGSSELCDELASKSPISNLQSPIIRVLHQANAGLSAARNSGIKAANGDYLMFVDSDDYIEPNVLGRLMEQVEREQLDVLRFDYQNVRLAADNVLYEVFEPNKQPHRVDRRNMVVDGETYLNKRLGYACYAWQFIIRKDVVDAFTEGLHFEDVDWLPRMMLAAKRVNSTTTLVYNYFWREGSITLTQGKIEKIRKNINDRMKIISNYSQLIPQYPNCLWLRNMQSSIVAGTLMSIAKTFYNERDSYVQQLLEMNVFPLSVANQGNTFVRRARIINLFGPKLYCALMHLRNRF